MSCYNAGVPRTLDEYVDRLEFALRHLECCWEEDLWPGACNGKPVRFTLRVQRSEVTDGGFEPFIVARTALLDGLKLLSPYEQRIVRVYSWVGADGPNMERLWQHYAWRVNLRVKQLRDSARLCLRKMATGRTVKRGR